MNPTLHRPIEVELVPVPAQPSGIAVENIFTLKMRYCTEGTVYSVQWVYVPKSLQTALLTGDVASFHLEALEQGSRAQNFFGFPLCYVVLGVKTKAGVELEEVPKELQRGWWLDMPTGLGFCLAGAILVSTSYAWAGCLALLFGSNRLRQAFQIPRRPFWVSRQVV